MTQLLPIDNVIRVAKSTGVSFGPGNPRARLAYLGKLRLLPPAVRKKVSGHLTGCYPEDVVTQLQRIETLREAGLTYSQIRFRLNHPQNTLNLSFPLGNVAFLIVGLILGWLVAATSLRTSTTTPIATNEPPSTILSLDPKVQEVFISSLQGKTGGQIFVISVPDKPGFDKLDKTSINQLVTY